MRGDRSTIRAIRGPITLITLGVLFALQNFTSYGFDQTWPVLLIVFGLLSLMGRSAPQPPGPAQGAPPYNYPPAGYRTQSYAGSGYAQAPPAAPASGTEKGGFGASAPASGPPSGSNPGGAA